MLHERSQPEDGSESLGTSDSDSEDDADYVPRPKRPKFKKKKKKPKMPNLTELSLPKPSQRLDQDLDLGDAALSGCAFSELELTRLSSPRLPDRAPPTAKVALLAGRRPTRSAPDDPRITEFRAIYSVQLPGMPFYNEAVHALLTLDPAGEDVAGGATFRLGMLQTAAHGPILILDILALAVHPERARGGVGSTLVSVLQAVAAKEAAARGAARPLMLTQADLSCIQFWAKNGFARALDANALVRSLRRSSGHTIFDAATPMAQALPKLRAAAMGNKPPGKTQIAKRRPSLQPATNKLR